MTGRPMGQAGVWLVVAAAMQWALLGPMARCSPPGRTEHAGAGDFDAHR